MPPSSTTARETSHDAVDGSTCNLAKNCAHASCSSAAVMSASTCFAATPAMAASEYTRALRFVVSSSTVSRNASRDALAAARFAAASSMRAWFSGLCSTAGGACGGGGNLGSSARSGSNVSTKDDRMECASASSASALATGAVTRPSEEGAEKLQLSGSGRFPPHVRYATTASHTHATATNSTATWVFGVSTRERGFPEARGEEAVSEAATNGGREISNATSFSRRTRSTARTVTPRCPEHAPAS